MSCTSQPACIAWPCWISAARPSRSHSPMSPRTSCRTRSGTRVHSPVADWWRCWPATRWLPSAMPRSPPTSPQPRRTGPSTAWRWPSVRSLHPGSDDSSTPTTTPNRPSSAPGGRRPAIPFLVSLPAAIWRRAVRGDEVGVASLRDLARQHQMYIPFAEFVAVALLRGVDEALDDVKPRWSSPRNGLSIRNLGFHLAQLEASLLTGNLEVVDDLFQQFDPVYRSGVRASHDWPISVALAMAAATIELGDLCSRLVDRAIAGGGHRRRARCSSRRSSTSTRHATPSPAVAAVRSNSTSGRTAALETPRRPRRAIARPTAARAVDVGRRSSRDAVGTDTDRDVHRHRGFDAADVQRRQRRLGSNPRRAPPHSSAPLSGRCRGSIMTATGDGFSAWFEQPTTPSKRANAASVDRARLALVVPGGSVEGACRAWRPARCSISAPTCPGWRSPRRHGSCRRPDQVKPDVSRSVIDHGLDARDRSICRCVIVEGLAPSAGDLHPGADRARCRSITTGVVATLRLDTIERSTAVGTCHTTWRRGTTSFCSKPRSTRESRRSSTTMPPSPSRGWPDGTRCCSTCAGSWLDHAISAMARAKSVGY